MLMSGPHGQGRVCQAADASQANDAGARAVCGQSVPDAAGPHHCASSSTFAGIFKDKAQIDLCPISRRCCARADAQ